MPRFGVCRAPCGVAGSVVVVSYPMGGRGVSWCPVGRRAGIGRSSADPVPVRRRACPVRGRFGCRGAPCGRGGLSWCPGVPAGGLAGVRARGAPSRGSVVVSGSRGARAGSCREIFSGNFSARAGVCRGVAGVVCPVATRRRGAGVVSRGADAGFRVAGVPRFRVTRPAVSLCTSY